MAARIQPISLTGKFTDMTHEVTRITPDMAHEWLESNTRNRNIRAASVNAYARDMIDGNWSLNGEAIKFAADGTLLDGQHRLHAIVKANVTVKCLVVRGLSPEAQNTMDSGVGRRFADQLGFSGESHPQILGAVLRRILLWESGLYIIAGGSTYKPTYAEMAESLQRHPEARECVVYGVGRSRSIAVHGAIVSFVAWLLGTIDHDDSRWFLDRLSDGVGLPANHPVLTLRERLRRERELGAGRGIEASLSMALILMAWNAHRENRTLAKLQLPVGGLTNDNFPLPRR